MIDKLSALPGAKLALGAFILTVLLGLGGAAASALWQQTATATMTVTAAPSWPGEITFTRFTCTNDSPKKVATLTAIGASKPTSMTYSALQVDGTYGPSYDDAVSLGTASTVTIRMNSKIIADNRSTSLLTIRVVATYADQTHSTGTAVVGLEQGNSSDKVTCISTNT